MFAPCQTAREEMLPLLDAILALIEGEAPEVHRFFSRIHAGLSSCKEEEDLAMVFMDLSTAAFVLDQGTIPIAAFPLIDRVLAEAQLLSTTLSAGSDVEQ